jgi:hypothetical protein
MPNIEGATHALRHEKLVTNNERKNVLKMTEQHMHWVVYSMTLHGKKNGMNAVCRQEEWEAMERGRPGYHKLIQAGIASEAEAEKLARSCQPPVQP